MSQSHSNARASVMVKTRSDLSLRFNLVNIFTGSSIIFGDLDTSAKQFMISFIVVLTALNFYLGQMSMMGAMRALASDQTVEEAATAHGKGWIESSNSKTGMMMVVLISVGVPLVQLYAIYM